MEDNNQVLDATNSNEELELDFELDNTEDIEAPVEESADKKFARQALARAKTAEAELKALKAKMKPEATQTINQTLTADEVEVKILKAQGISTEEIDYLKKLAILNNTSIIEAQSDSFFVNFKEQLEAKSKAEKARLGASKHGGSVKAEKSFNSPAISDDDHKALWKQAQG